MGLPFSAFLLDILYPNRCGCCGCRIPPHALVCTDCAGEIADCSVENDAWEKRHPDVSVPWDDAAAVCSYQGAAKTGILRAKNGGINFVRYAATGLAGKIRLLCPETLPDLVTWVPVTKRRRRMQGYAHSENLAKAVSAALGIPANGALLTEQADTLRQHALPKALRTVYAERFRHTNIRLDGKSVLLCDDILTTGSTLMRCTQQLREAGAAQVYAAVIAYRIYG